jgi:methionyl-tRNA formyltransferase
LVDQGLLVLCGDGQPVVIHRVQPAGKKVMDASAWFNGLQRPDNLLLGEPLGVV